MKSTYGYSGTGSAVYFKGVETTKTTVNVPASIKVSGINYRVTSVAKNAFSDNKDITKVVLGKNVKKLGANAFKNDSALKTIVVNGKLTSVGKNSLKGIKKNAVIKIKATKKNYKAIKKAIKKTSGLPTTVKFKRIK